MKTKRELLLNTLSALNRMITLLFHLFLFSFLSSYGPLLLSCSASRLPGTTLSRALVPRSCVKKKGKIVEVSCVILLRRFPWRLWYWQRFNIVSIVGNFRFICFSIFWFLYLRLFLVLLFKRKSLEFTGPCLSLLSMDDDIFFSDF